jgi:hypothetical protein
MNVVENRIGSTGAAPAINEGGPAPSGAHAKKLVKIDDREVPQLLKKILATGAVVVGFTPEGLPIIQIYDRQLQRYRRFRWCLVDRWWTREVDMFEVVE